MSSSGPNAKYKFTPKQQDIFLIIHKRNYSIFYRPKHPNRRLWSAERVRKNVCIIFAPTLLDMWTSSPAFTPSPHCAQNGRAMIINCFVSCAWPLPGIHVSRSTRLHCVMIFNVRIPVTSTLANRISKNWNCVCHFLLATSLNPKRYLGFVYKLK